MHSLEFFYYGIDWRLAKIAVTGVAVFLISGYTVISPRLCRRREKNIRLFIQERSLVAVVKCIFSRSRW